MLGSTWFYRFKKYEVSVFRPQMFHVERTQVLISPRQHSGNILKIWCSWQMGALTAQRFESFLLRYFEPLLHAIAIGRSLVEQVAAEGAEAEN